MLVSEIQLRQELGQMGEFIRSITAEEFSQQGHSLTGKSLKSIKYKVSKQSKTWTIEISHAGHMSYLNTGVPADRVAYTRNSGAGKSAFIAALIKWVKLRGIAKGFTKSKSIAFAIANTMKKEGIPTKGSFEFTKNGRRTGWLDQPINKQETKIEEKLEEVYCDFIAAKLEEKINRLVEKYENVYAL